VGLTGADLLVTELKRQGVTWVSTLCGNGLNPFYLACRRAGIRLIDTHNEQAAAYMADSYARLTGRVGVCVVSSGVAHSNALTGVANAFFDGSPLLLITGASAGYGACRGVFQEFNQVALAKPICKFAKWVSRTDDLAFLVRKAFTVALSGRPGPVHLTIPIDVLENEVEPPTESAKADASEASSKNLVDLFFVSEAVQAIESSNRPLILAGSGVFYSGGCDALLRFSEASAIPIVTPIWDRGVVDTPHPNFLGVVGAASGEPRLLEDADLIILAGVRADYRVGFLRPPKVKEDVFIIRVNRDACELNRGVKPNLSFSASPPLVFDQLANSIGSEGKSRHEEWLEEARERCRIFYSRWVDSEPPAAKPMSGWCIVNVIRPLLTEDVVFLVDGGNIGQWAHMLLTNDRYPSYWLTCGASGVVGWGIPGAMAARLAYPDRPVLLLSGDGSFGFTVTELESAVRQNFSFVAVVANDGAWGIVVNEQKRQFDGEDVIASRFGPIRFDKVAEALGAKGIHVEDPEELSSAIQEGFQTDLPTVINVPISIGGPSEVKQVSE